MNDRRDAEDALAEVAADALRHLSWLRSAGILEVPPPRAVQPAAARAYAPEPAARPAAPPAVPPAAPVAAPPAAAPSAPAPVAATLQSIRADLGDCTRCKLAGGRTNLVFGVGAPDAELVFVGEGPGEDEDLKGEPFVGRAGQLLTKMIEAMGFRREQVYIANVVKCRPPGNRNPEPDEIEACEPFLRAQLSAIRPKVIVALGKFAAQTLLRDTTAISRLRGRWFQYEGVRLMPTFHPAYLLRSPAEKGKAWEDLQLVMKELGKSLPKKG